MRLPRRDAAAAVGSTVFFSIALSVSAVVLPLAALAAGYSPAAVGFLTASAGVSQLGMRLIIGPLMRRFPDWILVLVATVAMSASAAVLAVSTALIPFLICQSLQGAARGAFWTGSQTHVVRGARSSAAALAGVGIASSCGQLVGPLAGGLIGDRSLLLALIIVAALGLLATILAAFLDRLPPFAPVRTRSAGRVWRRPAVNLACWSSMTTGAWRGLMGSYVPVALVAAGQSAAAVGLLVWVANAACLLGTGVVGRLGPRGLARILIPATVLCSVAVGFLALAAGHTPTAAGLLAISGLGAGVLQVVGPAQAVDAVDAEERGDAIAATGTFRSTALLGSPLIVAGMLGIAALGPAMLAAGGVMLAPTIMATWFARRTRRAASSPTPAPEPSSLIDRPSGPGQ